MQRRKLTKSQVDAADIPTGLTDNFLWCGDVRGFGVRIKKSGKKTFVVRYQTKRGQSRRFSIGTYPGITVEMARKIAITQLARVIEGADPSRERKRNRNYQTVAQLCDTYYAEAAAGLVLHKGKPKKPATLSSDKGRIERHIKPLLGSKAVDEVELADIEEMYHDITDGKTALDVKNEKKYSRSIVRGGSGTARKAVHLLSAMYAYAIRKKILKQNPCIGVQMLPDGSRERFLNEDEYARFGEALRAAHKHGVPKQFRDAIITIALTGFRKSEIITLTPAEIDHAAHGIRLKDSKTGKQLRPCGETALAFLDGIMTDGATWVFPSSTNDGPIVKISKAVDTLRKMAGLDGVSLHTLRHSYATVANELNYSEITIAGLLGHRKGSVTAKYAHQVEGALAAAADKVSLVIAHRMGLARPEDSSKSSLPPPEASGHPQAAVG